MKDLRYTSNHQEIREWVENHKGQPAMIEIKGIDESPIGIRIDFEGKEDERDLTRAVRSQPTTWEVFFEIFERQGLAFVYRQSEEIKDPSLSYRFAKRVEENDKVGEILSRTAKEMAGVLESGVIKENLIAEEDKEAETPNVLSPQMQDEQSMLGHMPSPESDDDTTAMAASMNLLLQEDLKRIKRADN